MLLAGEASAAVIGSNKLVDFTGSSVSFAYGTADFTFTDVETGFFDPNAVGVSTSGGGAVTAFGAPFYDPPQPTDYFDPVRGDGVLLFDSSYTHDSFPATTAIPYSATPFFIGLEAVQGDGTHFGYGEFLGTALRSYAFETTPGIGIQAVSVVPLPAGLPMFGAGVLALGAIGYGMKRRVAAIAFSRGSDLERGNLPDAVFGAVDVRALEG